MPRTLLFLLKSEFSDPDHGCTPFFCPQCLAIEGLLAMFPKVRQNLEVRHVDFARPRGALEGFVGDDQSCPQIVLPNGDDAFSSKLSEQGLGEVRRIKEPKAVQDYLIVRFGLPNPHP